MAAPHVAGALALLKAEFPNDSYRQLINRILRNVDPVPGFAGKVQTGGRLNLERALRSNDSRPFNDDFAARARVSGTNLSIPTSTRRDKRTDQHRCAATTSSLCGMIAPRAARALVPEKPLDPCRVFTAPPSTPTLVASRILRRLASRIGSPRRPAPRLQLLWPAKRRKRTLATWLDPGD